MMDADTRKRLEDFFEGFELVEYLQISISDVVDAFEDLIEENIEDVEELLGVRERKGYQGYEDFLDAKEDG